ncbi:hypothetical protein GCM10020221_11150 [Streptomyces thioluteus]|uniref:MrfA-like Zn-binding domain-containing protein n=1 Tax=Streptomyces thioluteus TaxID=66431 RepID=A0ABN3WL92_STRTU
MSPQAADELRAYATDGLQEKLDTARRNWEDNRDELRRRVEAIDEADRGLPAGEPEQERRRRELRAERRAVNHRSAELSRQTAHTALVELGLLPNYSLIDSLTWLDATLTWKEETEDGIEYKNRTLTYGRSALLALTDLAPGNHFYVQGYKHRITGLDIGSPRRPSWLWWRVCPDCGHVRTHRAENDPSACPRCRSTAIGDAGCLHRVLVPQRVHSRDRRDDIRVRDDTDDRERRHYTVIPAVDIAQGAIEKGDAWRHRKATFGWEFTRRAVVRHLNAGAARVESATDDAFAGRRVRLNPFWVCRSCGFADPDGGPAGDHHGDETVNPAKYHRPWCPALRETDAGDRPADAGVRLLLAHELRTEALRILIPAVTAHTQERLVSFKALLLAGIAHSYGGDPDHLSVVTASMPDPGNGDRDVRRNFLVLYDTLPGGTGYLHRLAGPEGLREVLARARQVIESCACLAEGRPACHRCLLRHVADSEYPHVSRQHALDMLGELFGRDGSGWHTEPVDTTEDITLVPQVESELEALFRRGLLAWAERTDEVSVRTALTPDGEHDVTLRFRAPDGTVTGWRMETQTDLGFTRPDVVFRSTEDDRRVAVYLDGYRYHAHRDCNRIAGDADKRTRLRSGHGWMVFQLTWDDVQTWAGERSSPDDPVWVPYRNAAQRVAQDVHRRRHGGDPRDLPRWVWTNPVETLIGYLTHPDPELWRLRAQSALAGFAAVQGTGRALADGPEIGRRIGEALRGGHLSGGQGAVQVMAAKDAAGCPLTLVLDLRGGQSGAVWSALTVLDDSPEALAGPEEAHRRRWRAWLYWTNLLQFLNEGEGDGVQLAASRLPGFDPLELNVSGGAGWLTSRRQRYVPDAGEETGPDAGTATAVRDPGWDTDVLPYLVDEPGLRELAGKLASMGVPAPEAGYELGDAAWPAELAWPTHRTGVVLAHRPGADGTPDSDAQDRDAAFAKAGWRVRTAAEWDARDLAEGLAGPPRDRPSAPGPARHEPQENDDEEHDR